MMSSVCDLLIMITKNLVVILKRKLWNQATKIGERRQRSICPRRVKARNNSCTTLMQGITYIGTD
jgi:hypothetical protein